MEYLNVTTLSITILVIFGASKLFGSNAQAKRIAAQRKEKQSQAIGAANKGEGPVHRSLKSKELVETYKEGVKTVYDIFQTTLAAHGSQAFLGTRKKDGNKAGDYEWITYNEASVRRNNLGAGLLSLGQKTDEPVGIYSINRAEWILADLACYSYRFPSVALYDTLGQNSVEFVLKHAEIKTVICAAKQLPQILTAIEHGCPIKVLVSMDSVTDDHKAKATKLGVNLLTIAEVEKMGAEKPVEHNPGKAEDIYTIMYTSGTTGDPKGVLLSHANLVSEVAGVRLFEPSLFSESDVHMSYLPLAHSFERAVVFLVMSYGGKVGFYQGIITELFNDIATLKPTFLVGAPRVWSRLQEKITHIVNSQPGLKKNIFWYAYKQKQQALQTGAPGLLGGVWDMMFAKTKASLGGRVKFILSGSAPLDPRLGEFLKICFGCPVLEGYGLTENFAGAFISPFNDTQLGHVGAPLPHLEAKLQDDPDTNYKSSNDPPTGEIMLRGGSVFKGYYKDPEKTKEALEADGWFHTGDIGRWNANGTLSIIDRKKNIFKLSQGEYVAVEYLEGIYVQCQLVQQIWVYGSSYKRYLVAVVVPGAEAVELWAKENNLTGDYTTLVQNPKLKDAIVKELNQMASSCKLKGFEFIKGILVIGTPFSTDNDLMTPTFKLRRNALLKHFDKEIGELYAAIPESD